MPALNSRVVGVIEINEAVGQHFPGVDADRFACDTGAASTAAIIQSIHQTTRSCRRQERCVASTCRLSMAEIRYAHVDGILADFRQLSEDLKQEWSAFIAAN